MRDLTQTAIDNANEDGKLFIQKWIRKPIQEIYFVEGNWFIVLTENFGYAIPYTDNSAKASHFGPLDYTQKYLAKETLKDEMFLIATAHGYKYWRGTDKDGHYYNITPQDEPRPGGGYRAHEFICRVKKVQNLFR